MAKVFDNTKVKFPIPVAGVLDKVQFVSSKLVGFDFTVTKRVPVEDVGFFLNFVHFCSFCSWLHISPVFLPTIRKIFGDYTLG